MSDLHEKAKKFASRYKENFISNILQADNAAYVAGIEVGYIWGQREYEEKLRWIPVDEEEPICVLEDEDIHYSKYLEIKVKGYEHPFIGYYVKANDDQFFDFIHKSVDEGIKQDEITHYRFVVEA